MDQIPVRSFVVVIPPREGVCPSLLIWIIKPEGNSVKKTPYTGRNIAIQNVGADFGLPEYLDAIKVGSCLRVGYGSPGDMKVKMITPPW